MSIEADSSRAHGSAAASGEMPDWAEWAVYGVWGLLAVVNAITYSGPYRWASEWQLDRFGRYYEVASFAVYLVAGGLPTHWLLGRVMRGRSWPGLRDWRTMRRLPWIPAALTLFCAAMAMLAYRDARELRPLLRTSPGGLLAPGVSQKLVWVEVTGIPDERVVRWKEDGGPPMLVMALRDASAPAGAAPPLVLEVPEAELERRAPRNPATGTRTVRGIARHRPLDGPVRTRFEEMGLRLGESPWVLNARQDPADVRRQGPLVLALGAVAVLVAWGAYFQHLRRSARG
ncbi:MAG TPA: hypothetical protein VFQ45_01170 [Longimicrobium sp.]|nr:hypothetical protein [Longimicrobium sp.]